MTLLNKTTFVHIIAFLSVLPACRTPKNSAYDVMLHTEEKYAESFIFSPGQFASVHASTIVELQDGTLMACWFAGKREADKSVQIRCAKRTMQKWQNYSIAVKNGEKTQGSWLNNKFVGNPVLFHDEHNTLWLFYEAVEIGGHSGAAIDFKTSKDQGNSWSSSKRFAGGFGNFGHLVRNKPLRLSSGRIVIPAYREFTSKYSYSEIVRLKDEDIIDRQYHRIPETGHLQPSIIHFKTKLFAYMRSTQTKKVLYSVFDFSSQKWSLPQPTNLPNPNSALDSVVTTDGKVLIVYNSRTDSRDRLSLAYSNDGVYFTRIYDFENQSEMKFSYPAIIKDRNERFHVTYTFNRTSIKHVSFDRNWLEKKIQKQNF